MPRMEVIAAIVVAFALAYLWMMWDERQALRKRMVEEKVAGAAGDANRRRRGRD